MAGAAEDQCFASAGGHDLHPAWFLAALISVEVFERTDVMHLNGVCQACCPTVLTYLGQESLFEF
jgi:hypothetical protein